MSQNLGELNLQGGEVNSWITRVTIIEENKKNLQSMIKRSSPKKPCTEVLFLGTYFGKVSCVKVL